MSFFDKIRQGLTKTRDALFGGVASVFQPGRKLTDEDYESLEAALLRADVGPATTDKLLDEVKRRLADNPNVEPASAMRAAILALFELRERAMPSG
ncbi:MAG: signal recognition particle receptor subunit alpha, partial [Candidatus Eiseniibacteriota bacterium]